MVESEITLSMLIAMVIGMLSTAYLSRIILARWGLRMVSGITQFDYKGINLAVIAFIVTLVVFTTGFWGLLILIGGALLGFLAPLTGVRRAQAMGFFLVPVTLFYSGWQREIVSFLSLQSQASPPQLIQMESILLYMAIAISIAFIVYYIASEKVFRRALKS